MTIVSSMITKILWNTKLHISRDAVTFLSMELETAGEEILKLSTNEYSMTEAENIESVEKRIFNDKLNDVNTTGEVFHDVVMKILENNKTIINHDAVTTLARLLEKITVKILEYVQKKKHITETDMKTAEKELFETDCETADNESRVFHSEKVTDVIKNKIIYRLLTIQKETASGLIKDPIPSKYIPV